MSEDLELRCRVCGLEQSEPPWGPDGQTASFDICPCCGTEAGYEDQDPSSAKAARERWLARGAPWFAAEERPEEWNLDAQLARIPEAWR